MSLTRQQIKSDLNRAGIVPGSRVMVHSSYKSLGGVEGGPVEVVHAFLDAVYPEGVVVFPTFDFKSWTQRGSWDYWETPSQMGVITEKARTGCPEHFVRTLHPIYSCITSEMAPGSRDACVDAFGVMTFFEHIIQKNYTIVVLGVPDVNNSFTIVHQAEVTADPPNYWRERKEFVGTYCDPWGVSSRQSYFMHVRKEGVTTNIRPFVQLLLEKGVIQEHRVGPARTLVASSQEFAEHAMWAAISRPELLREAEG